MKSVTPILVGEEEESLREHKLNIGGCNQDLIHNSPMSIDKVGENSSRKYKISHERMGTAFEPVQDPFLF